jgi:hypothetical protein
MAKQYIFKAIDLIDKRPIKISSLNFDDSGLVQLSGFTGSGKLIHIPISEVDLEVTLDRREDLITINQLAERLNVGRHYLMGVDPSKLTVEDALEAFGFGKNGLDY